MSGVQLSVVVPVYLLVVPHMPGQNFQVQISIFQNMRCGSTILAQLCRHEEFRALLCHLLEFTLQDDPRVEVTRP